MERQEIRPPTSIHPNPHLVHVAQGDQGLGGRKLQGLPRKRAPGAKPSPMAERAVGCAYQAKLLRAHARTIFDLDAAQARVPPRSGLYAGDVAGDTGAVGRIRYMTVPPPPNAPPLLEVRQPPRLNPELSAVQRSLAMANDTGGMLPLPSQHHHYHHPQRTQTPLPGPRPAHTAPDLHRRYTMSYSLTVLFRILQDPHVQGTYGHYGMWDCFRSVVDEVYAGGGAEADLADLHDAVAPEGNARDISAALGQRQTYRQVTKQARGGAGGARTRGGGGTSPAGRLALPAETVVSDIPRKIGRVRLGLVFSAWRNVARKIRTLREVQQDILQRKRGGGGGGGLAAFMSPLVVPSITGGGGANSPPLLGSRLSTAGESTSASRPRSRTGSTGAPTPKSTRWSLPEVAASVAALHRASLISDFDMLCDTPRAAGSPQAISPYSGFTAADADGRASAYLLSEQPSRAALPAVASHDALRGCAPLEEPASPVGGGAGRRHTAHSEAGPPD